MDELDKRITGFITGNVILEDTAETFFRVMEVRLELLYS